MMQRKCDFNQSGYSGRALGVADHGLGRSDGTALARARAALKTRLSDSTSAWSPATVPVP